MHHFEQRKKNSWLKVLRRILPFSPTAWGLLVMTIVLDQSVVADNDNLFLGAVVSFFWFVGATTWLFTIARNRRIDILRREKYPELDPEDPALVPDEEVQPDDAVIMAERKAEVQSAMATLPEEQVELVKLAFYKGWSHSEIAKETGLPLGTVKSRLRLSFTRLKEALDGKV